VARYAQEYRLFEKLPITLRSEVRRLEAAMVYVQNLTTGKGKIKVQTACQKALAIYPDFKPLKTFRGKFDVWNKEQDWLLLVNRAKAGTAWQRPANGTGRGLSDRFLDYVAKRAGEFRRADALEQAILSIHRQWATGRTQRGVEEVIPGYEEVWATRTRALLPEGWHPSNLRNQLKKRAKWTKATKALLHEGIHAAKEYLPQVHATRGGEIPLRFMELVQFDDVRCDFRVMDTESGQVNDLWLLVARDVATTMLLGFGMRPARARDDGTQEHLKLQDMKQLCGWLLETYGLPPYLMTWRIERGTATPRAGHRRCLGRTGRAGAHPRFLFVDDPGCIAAGILGEGRGQFQSQGDVGKSQPPAAHAHLVVPRSDRFELREVADRISRARTRGHPNLAGRAAGRSRREKISVLHGAGSARGIVPRVPPAEPAHGTFAGRFPADR
jgi:hypothetical protein